MSHVLSNADAPAPPPRIPFRVHLIAPLSSFFKMTQKRGRPIYYHVHYLDKQGKAAHEAFRNNRVCSFASIRCTYKMI